jgi:Tol biopolymer transport system component
MRLVTLGTLILLAAAVITAGQNGNDLYQQGLARETAGDIKGAIQVFERIVRDFSSNRALTARALLQLGRWSDLLGEDQARKHYERVIREYGDQTDAAAEARNRLAALDSGRPGAGLTTRRVNMPRDDSFSITADGRLAAIVDWTTADLAVYDMSTGQTRRLLANTSSFSGGWPEGPLLSPDLRQVAYSWSTQPGRDQRYQLRVMPNQPGAQARVVIDSREFIYFTPSAWSRDGKSILANIWKPDRTMHLAWISVADGTVKVLKSLGGRTFQHANLSADDRYIVYSAPQGPDTVNSSIHVLAADGTGETELVTGTSINEAPVWTPDGARVFFTSNRSGSFALWSIAVRNGRAGGSPELVKPDLGRIVAKGFTSSGTYYYMHLTSSSDIYVAELDPASSKVRGAAVPITETLTGSRLPAWSPDGNAVAFARSATVSNLDENDLVVRFVGTGKERTYAGANVSGQPTWLPDGKSLLVPVRRQGQTSLQRVNLETGEFTPTLDKEVRQATLAPDGKTLYVAVNRSIQAIDLATGRERQVFAGSEEYNISALALSPDGKTLAFPLQRRAVGLVGVDGSGFRQLQAEGIRQVGWTPDGRAILFEAQSGGPSNRKLMRLSVEGGEPEFTGLDIQGVFSLHPDGTRIAFSRNAAGTQRNVEVWALDNLLDKPAR